MKIRSIDILENRSNNNESDYDLTQLVWTRQNSVNYFMYVVDKFDEMRLDNICYKIYGTTDHIDFLMFINDIINPLNIKEGDILIYTNAEDISLHKLDPDNLSTLRGNLINLSKVKKVDKNRSSDNNSLPPTIKSTQSEPVQFENGQVIIRRTT